MHTAYTSPCAFRMHTRMHNVRVQIFIRQKSLQIYIIFVFWLKLCLIYDLVLAYMPQHRSFWFQLLFWPQHIIKPEPGLSAYKLRLMEAYRNGFSREYTSFTCGQRIMRWSGWHMDRTIQSAVVNPPYQMLIVHWNGTLVFHCCATSVFILTMLILSRNGVQRFASDDGDDHILD